MRQRHPRIVDAVVAVVVAAFTGLVLTGRTGATVAPARPLDWAGILLVAAPLIWRRRAPVLTYWAVIVTLTAFMLLGAHSPAALLVPVTALHAVARYRPVRYVVPAALATVLPGFLNRIADHDDWIAFGAVSGLILTTALVGITQRTRQAYLTALEERAERLERDRDQQARLAVAEERARIARDMHDVVAHHLSVMVALSNGAAATVPAAPGRAVEVMEQVSATGRQALAEMRRLVGVLRRGGILDADAGGRVPQPALDDLDALVERVRSAGLRVELVRDGAPGAWGPGAGLTVYRIVQEALTNTLKHAGPRATVQVRLSYRDTGAHVSVVDDGAGRPAHQGDAAGRHGLTGMCERATAYGGAVLAGPRTGGGWQVEAYLPFDQPVAR